MIYSAKKSGQAEENLLLLRRFFSQIETLPFDEVAQMEYGSLLFELEKKKRKYPHPHDLIHCAIARVHQMTIATLTPSRYEGIPGIQVEIFP
jgi:predicted nucleic acid-binding protein